MKPLLRLAAVAVAVWAALPLLMRADAPAQGGAAETQLRLASILAAEGRYLEALDAYQRVLVVEDPAVLAAARKGMVRAALRTANFPVAAEQAALLVGGASRDAEVLALNGDALWAMGLFDEAEAAYREAVVLNPAEARGRRGLARSLAGRNRLEAALGEALVAGGLAPGDPDIHQTLGLIYERLRRFEDAARELTTVVALLPLRDSSPQSGLLRSQAAYLRTFRHRAPLEMRPSGGPRVHTVPFEEVRGKVVVQARVNGREWTDFVIDTGAERTVLSRRSAERFGVSSLVRTISAGVGDIGVRVLEVGTLDSLEIGSLRINNLPCLIKNPPLDAMPTRDEDGVSPPALGLSVRIDYKRRLLTLGTDLPEEPADFELPLRLNRLVTVKGLVDNAQAANFLVDTGGEVISISSATARSLNKPSHVRRIPLKVYGISGWDRGAYLLPGVDLAFDAIRYTNYPVVVLDLEAPSVLLGYQLGGIVGRSFLSKYRVDLDLEKSVLRLKGL